MKRAGGSRSWAYTSLCLTAALLLRVGSAQMPTEPTGGAAAASAAEALLELQSATGGSPAIPGFASNAAGGMTALGAGPSNWYEASYYDCSAVPYQVGKSDSGAMMNGGDVYRYFQHPHNRGPLSNFEQSDGSGTAEDFLPSNDADGEGHAAQAADVGFTPNQDISPLTPCEQAWNLFTEGGFGKRVTQAQFGDMYGVVHKALMAYPVFIGREADIVNYGIRTMDEGKTFPDPGSTAEPLGVGGRFSAEKVVTRGIARMIKEEALPLNPAQVARWVSSKTYGPNVLGANNGHFQARLKGMWGNLDKFVQATIQTGMIKEEREEMQSRVLGTALVSSETAMKMRGVQRPYAWAREIKEAIQDYIDTLNQNLGGLNILAIAYTLTTCISTTGDELAAVRAGYDGFVNEQGLFNAFTPTMIMAALTWALGIRPHFAKRGLTNGVARVAGVPIEKPPPEAVRYIKKSKKKFVTPPSVIQSRAKARQNKKERRKQYKLKQAEKLKLEAERAAAEQAAAAQSASKVSKAVCVIADLKNKVFRLPSL